MAIRVTDHVSYTSYEDTDASVLVAAIWKHDTDVVWYSHCDPIYDDDTVIIRCESNAEALELVNEALRLEEHGT